MSCHRAHRVFALRLVVVSRDPLAPDTDLHHRMIRECWVDCRTDGASGRDEKDVGVRSCSCGVAEKKSATWNGSRGPRGKLTRNPEPYSVWKVARRPGLRSCTNGTIAWCKCPATSEWYARAQGKSSATIAASTSSCCLYSYKPKTRRLDHRGAYSRTKPKQGAESFAAIELGSFSGGSWLRQCHVH
jgi:hypothetical protein